MNFGGRVTAPTALVDRMDTEEAPADGRGDLELLTAHLAGDARAFPALVDRHERQLWWTAVRHSRTESDAADAMQEGLVKALRSASAFRRDSSVATWLHRIVVNSCHDRMRGRHGPPDGVVDDRVTPAPDAGDGADPALGVVMRQAMSRLPEEQRRVIVEVDLMGWPLADVARRMGIPEGTVKSRRARARATLRRQLRRLDSEVDR
ncbi:RNA polymerase sigma factor SigM [Corynebacterium hansenii]|uniref:RNA polymerase sigma factor SigM n=1 Tax=Corynebacterium hansenii TaxID=394964 RepID=A0ABV7ZN03_9CORY|nr:RNA polymerase sigma factor SigM [Corynebacterium hansenii]WJZ01308.1 ECF RNA polymerase sigma factor SigM [Corynebacterium hansenii]